jgi:uncharacterized protein
MSISNEPMLIFQQANSDQNGQCDCDCDCACTNIITTTARSSSRKIDSHIFQKATEKVMVIPLSENNLLCVNTNSGFPVVLNEAAYKIWSNLHHPFSTEQLKDRLGLSLLKTGILVNGLHQAQLIKKIGASASQTLYDPSSKLLTAWMHITNDCQLACVYCYVEKSNERMSLETGQRSLDILFRLAEKYQYKRIKIKYAGGEPTLNFDLIKSLHYEAKQRAKLSDIRLKEVILSNGIQWDIAKINFVSQENIDVMISWDGLGETHNIQRRTPSGKGTASLVQRTIERMLEAGLHPHISITISAKSLNELESQVTWLLQKRVQFSLNFYRPSSTLIDNGLQLLDSDKLIGVLHRIYTQIEQNLPPYSLLNGLLDRTNLSFAHSSVCSVGMDYLVIDHQGNISKCQMEMENKLTDINNSDPLAVIRSSEFGVQNLPVDKKENCHYCTWRYFCGGGCPLEAKRIQGDYSASSLHCQVYKQFFSNLLRLEGLRMLKYSSDNERSPL